MRLIAFLYLLLTLSPVCALEKVSVQLNWKHQFQFAGYYAAIEQGYFRDAGFAVSLRELAEGGDPVASVLKGEADYGVGASELALQRGRGKPVVALATIIQNSPLVLLANRRTVPNVEALNGARIMLVPHEVELLAYLKREGVAHYVDVPHSFDPDDLIAGRVDAISAYSTDEPFLLRQLNFNFLTFTPKAAGISFYGDTLFTAESRVRATPAAVQAFRAAVVRGWVYAMAHPEEMADLILKHYSTRHSKAHLMFEASEMKRLMQYELVDIGQMSASRWQMIARTYAEIGLLPADFSIDGLIYQGESRKLPLWVWALLLAGLVIFLLLALFSIYFARLNLRLTRAMESRQSIEQALRDSEERYRRLAEQSKDVIWTLDLASMRFTYVSPSIERVRGFTPAEVMQQDLAATLTPASFEQVVAMLHSHLQRISQGDTSALSSMAEVDQPHKNGSVVSSEVVASFMLGESGVPVAVLGVSRDISERRAAEAQLRAVNENLRDQLEKIELLQVALKEQTIRDSLTGCFNRRYLDETLERELWRSRREGYPLALVMLDLDHFKRVNDTHGHQAGDEVLRALAETLQAEIRQEDIFCRYGGEEFVVLMPHILLAVAAERAERWRLKVADMRVRFGDLELTLTASFGVAAYPNHGRTADELTHFADMALYTAKSEGRNRVVVYTPPLS